MIQPLHDNVLVRKATPPEQTASGLYIPECAQGIQERIDGSDGQDQYRYCAIAEVLAVGPGRWRDSEFCRTVVRPGQKVMIGPWEDWKDGDTALIQEADIRFVID